MKIITSVKKMILCAKKIHSESKTIGFVPTMGYLHEGHLSLARRAKKDCDVVIMSIYVNPAQFGPHEDFKKYPRDLKRDEKLAKTAGVDIIFTPSNKDMYPQGFLTYVNVKKTTDCLCGKLRPGHFKGVTTVVSKLFNIVQPYIAYFGQKDAQQSVVIKQMVKDLNSPVKIKVMPIVREKDGLAMSSRNKYLDPQERKDAVILYQSLEMAKQLVRKGENNPEKIESEIKRLVLTKPNVKIDYVSVVNRDTLQPVEKITKGNFIVLAVWFGKTRLIDNIIV